MEEFTNLPDLTELKDSELIDQFSKLLRRHQIASTSGMPQSVLAQIETFMSHVQQEQQMRIYKLDQLEDEPVVIIDTDRKPTKGF